MIDQEEVRGLLDYVPETGEFISRRSGLTVGSVAGRGYVYVNIRRQRYLAHRLAWLYVHGVWPTAQIDHINRNKTDNRIANLREATNAENHQNRWRTKSTSGYQGVSWSTRDRIWRAQISVNGKNIYIGGFKSKEDALAAYLERKREIHGFWTGPDSLGDASLVCRDGEGPGLESSRMAPGQAASQGSPLRLLEAAGLAGDGDAKDAR